MQYETLTPQQLDELFESEEALDNAYEEAAAYDAQLVEEAELGFDADELETEADLYKYWKP